MGGDLFSSRSLRDPFIGRTLDGRYEVLERLGAGGVGVVYRGRQVQLRRLVAIKVLQRDTAALREWRLRFDREAKALSALGHPNIVPVTDFGVDGGVPYLVMELLQGKTLAELLKQGPVAPARALDIFRQVLRGLAFAHGKGIVHRDLKPANVFLQALPDDADHVRLLDFGMAKFLEGAGSRSAAEALTRVGAVFGTPAYMSPEQAKAAPVDARTDVYAAGVVLFQLLAGRLPFTGDGYEQVLKGHVLDPVPSLAKVRPDLPIASLVQPIIERAMAKKPAARYPDAGSMLAALEASGAPSRVGGGKRPPQTGSERGLVTRALRPVAALGALAAVAAAAVVVLRTEVSSPLERRPTRVIAMPNAAPPSRSATPSPQLSPSSAAPPPAPRIPTPSPEPSPTQAAAPAVTESAEAPTPAATPAAATPPQEEPPEGSDSPAGNPWRKGVPRALRSIRDGTERGARLSQRSLRPAYEFARENPNDPRPWLLLGRAYAQLDWLSDSTDRYLRAYRADPASRGDPHMLADLLGAAEHPNAGRKAAQAITEIYGAEALPALDKALKRRAPNPEVAARLARLRQSLSPPSE